MILICIVFRKRHNTSVTKPSFGFINHKYSRFVRNCIRKYKQACSNKHAASRNKHAASRNKRSASNEAYGSNQRRCCQLHRYKKPYRPKNEKKGASKNPAPNFSNHSSHRSCNHSSSMHHSKKL